MNKQELKLELELLKGKKDLLEKGHELKMERLRFERNSNAIFHDLALQRERIKSAEIKKAQIRRQKGGEYKH